MKSQPRGATCFTPPRQLGKGRGGKKKKGKKKTTKKQKTTTHPAPYLVLPVPFANNFGKGLLIFIQ